MRPPDLTRRADLLRDQLDHPPYGTRRREGAPPPVRVGVSGTGDRLLVIAWTAADLARERAAGTRTFRRLGVTPGVRVANTLAGALATPGSLLLGDVVEELGALDVPLGVVDSEAAARQAWELVDRVQPDVLVLADTATFFAHAPAAARPWWRGVVWLCSRSPVPASVGFAGWQRTWLAVPEATSFVAAECASGRLHVDERVVAEVIDDGGTPAPAGRDGTLVVTPLDLDAPLVRYVTDVRARLSATPCTCGDGGSILEPVSCG
jgi:phenylacetate-coenzyme A ligase PaaK-like adenylate-forming protein